MFHIVFYQLKTMIEGFFCGRPPANRLSAARRGRAVAAAALALILLSAPLRVLLSLAGEEASKVLGQLVGLVGTGLGRATLKHDLHDAAHEQIRRRHLVVRAVEREQAALDIVAGDVAAAVAVVLLNGGADVNVVHANGRRAIEVILLGKPFAVDVYRVQRDVVAACGKHWATQLDRALDALVSTLATLTYR